LPPTNDYSHPQLGVAVDIAMGGVVEVVVGVVEVVVFGWFWAKHQGGRVRWAGLLGGGASFQMCILDSGRQN
jgi:hypothetical protein